MRARNLLNVMYLFPLNRDYMLITVMLMKTTTGQDEAEPLLHRDLLPMTASILMTKGTDSVFAITKRAI